MSSIPVYVPSSAEKSVVYRVVSNLNALREELNEAFPGRQFLIDATILALAAGEHLFMYGDPGTAKSKFANTTLGTLQGARSFRITLNAQTPPSHLIGTQILKSLDEGKVDFNTENSLVTTDVAFVDEYANGNQMTTVSLNKILHEREFEHGQFVYPSSLMTAFAATNLSPSQMGNDPRVKANMDRFMFKVAVQELSTREDKLRMLGNSLGGGEAFDLQTRIKIEDLRAFHTMNKAKNFIGDSVLVSAYLDLVEKLESSLGTNVTDRSAVKTLQLLEVIAHLDGQTEVVLDDLLGLAPAFTDNSNQNQIATFRKIASEVIKKYEGEIGKKVDAAEAILIQQLTAQVPDVTRNSNSDDMVKASRKIFEIENLMKTIKPTLPETITNLDKLKQKVADRKTKISNYLNGV